MTKSIHKYTIIPAEENWGGKIELEVKIDPNDHDTVWVRYRSDSIAMSKSQAITMATAIISHFGSDE